MTHHVSVLSGTYLAKAAEMLAEAEEHAEHGHAEIARVFIEIADRYMTLAHLNKDTPD